MKKLLLLSLLLLMLFGAYHSNFSFLSTEVNQAEIPVLIQRNAKIQMGKEWDQAQNFYAAQKQRIQNNSEDFEAHLNLAELFVKEARITGEHGHYYPAALAMTDKILHPELNEHGLSDQLRFKALVTKAGVQLSLHDFSDALKTGKRALKLSSHNAQLYGVLVDCYVELGMYKEAVAMADRLAALKPDIRSYSRVSYLRELHGDVEGAIEAMTLAVKAGYPGNEETAWAMLTLGDLYKQYGKKDFAMRIYNEILLMRPDYPFAIAAIGDMSIDNGDLELAEKELNLAASIIPEVGYYTSLARLYKVQERNEEFDKIIAEIMIMLQDDVDAGHIMNLKYAAIYKDLLEEPDQAYEYAIKEYDKRPNNIEVNRILAQIEIAQNNKAAAMKHYVAACITNSKHPDLENIKQAL